MTIATSEEKRVRQRITEAAFKMLDESGFSDGLLGEATEKAGYEDSRAKPFFTRSEELVFALYLRLGSDWENQVIDFPIGSMATRFRAAMLGKLELIEPHRTAIVSLLPLLIDPRHELGALSLQTEIVRLRGLGVMSAVVGGATDKPHDSVDAQTLSRTLYHAHLLMMLLWCRDQSNGSRWTKRAINRVCSLLEKNLFQRPLGLGFLSKTDQLIQYGFHLEGSEEVNQTARNILGCIFRYRRLQEGVTDGGEADFALHLPKVRRAISLQEPVSLLLPAFPAKSPSPTKVLGVLPDMAEEIALCRLEALCEEIEAIYPAGARVVICSDGHVFSDLVGVPDETVTDYGIAIKNLIASLGLSHIDSFNMSDIFDGSNDSERREHLVNHYADSPEEIQARVQAHEHQRKLFNGIHRFLFEDTCGVTPEISRTQIRRETKERAYSVVARSEAWGRLLSECFPLGLRLSIHPQPRQSDKIGILLGPANDVWLTPWHGVALETKEGFRLLPRHEAEALGARIVFHNGQPSYFSLLPETSEAGTL